MQNQTSALQNKADKPSQSMQPHSIAARPGLCMMRVFVHQ